MTKKTKAIAKKLLSRIHSARSLKHVSDSLEALTQNQNFKNHANAIVSDPNLLDNQKRTQLLYLIRAVENPTLYDFFSDELADTNLWLFDIDKIDYFDKFVQEFQLLTEEVTLVHLATAVELDPPDVKEIAADLSDSFGYKVILNLEVNPSLLGGVQARVENLVFDYSLRSKFQQFERQWLKTLEDTQEAISTE